jgi:hypothetical protein
MRYFYLQLSCLFIALSGCASMNQDSFNSDKDPNVNFMNYRSFAWLPKDSTTIYNVLYDNQIVENNIITYSKEELEKRGYEFNNEKPDILLKYTFLIEKKNETINYPIYTSVPFPNQVTYAPYNPNISNYGSYNSPYYNPYYNNQYSAYNVNFYANNYPYNNGYGFPVGSLAGYPNGNGIPISSATYIAGTGFQQIEIKEGTLIIDVLDSKTKHLIWRGWSAESLSDPLSFEKRLPFEIKGIFNQFPERVEGLNVENK